MNNKNKKDFSTVRDLLQDFVKDNQRLEHGLNQLNIEKIWNSVMGSGVAKYTTNLKLTRETLYVQLNNSVLREELSYGKTKIIKLLNEELNKNLIKKLVFR